MKITCTCGAQIVDSTDGHPNKAHLIADERWTGLLDALDDEVVAPLAAGRIGEDAAAMRLRTLVSHAQRLAWQCTACGRVWIEDPARTLHGYAADAPSADRRVLRGG
ncbi:MAG: hypothetical protein H6825_01240 [Planctomycetes bacterium]|nr:hypothetical protein [Planctomycetota bacterium]